MRGLFRLNSQKHWTRQDKARPIYRLSHQKMCYAFVLFVTVLSSINPRQLCTLNSNICMLICIFLFVYGKLQLCTTANLSALILVPYLHRIYKAGAVFHISMHSMSNSFLGQITSVFYFIFYTAPPWITITKCFTRDKRALKYHTEEM